MSGTEERGRVFVATASFTTVLSDGRTHNVRRGVTRVREGHELLAGGRDQFFKMLEDEADYEIEEATAEPRSARRRGPAQRPRSQS